MSQQTIIARTAQVSRWYPEAMSPQVGDTVGVIRVLQERQDPEYEVCAPGRVDGYRQGDTYSYPSGGWIRHDDLGHGVVTGVSVDDYETTYTVDIDW